MGASSLTAVARLAPCSIWGGQGWAVSVGMLCAAWCCMLLPVAVCCCVLLRVTACCACCCCMRIWGLQATRTHTIELVAVAKKVACKLMHVLGWGIRVVGSRREVGHRPL